MASFFYDGSYRLIIRAEKILKINISCPDQFLDAKNLLQRDHKKDGRYDPKDHLKLLQESELLKNSKNPTLVYGIRNVMSNYRCIIYTENNISPDCEPPYSVKGENPLSSERPYYIIGEEKDNGKIIIEDYLPSQGNLKRFRWLFSGIPVLWDDFTEDELFKKILTEASDHSHVYILPRGNHPQATDETRSKWEQLHKIFIENIYQPTEVAFQSLYEFAKSNNLMKESNYVHSIIGLDENGNIIILIARGKLEDLGKEIKKLGAKRAICVENGGSITLLYYPNGVCDSEISLFALPNQRRPGTAFMVVEIEENIFGLLTK